MYEYDIQNVWKDKTGELKEEIIDFWLSEKAIGSRDMAEKRVDEVFFTARNKEGGIVGVNTAYKKYNRQLENRFYYYRTFIAPEARKSSVMGEMFNSLMNFLISRFENKEDTEAIGVLLEVENEFLKKRLNQAVWPGNNFVYIGKNERGAHLRVSYFPNALIS